MQNFQKKKLRLAAIIFLPIFLLLVLFGAGMYYSNTQQIGELDSYLSQEAKNFSAPPFANNTKIMEDESAFDMPTMSMEEPQVQYSESPELEYSLAISEETSENLPIMKTPLPEHPEISPLMKQQNAKNFSNENIVETSKNRNSIQRAFQQTDQLDFVNAEKIFLTDGESITPKNFQNFSYISADGINQIESEFSGKSLWNIFAITGGIAILMGGLSYFFAIKSLRPLEESLQKQKEFVANVSHELRTPLATIKSEAEVLKKNPENFEQEFPEFLDTVIADINHLDTLTTQLLQLSQIEKGSENTVFLGIAHDWNRVSQKFLQRAKKEEKEFSMPEISEDIVVIQPNIGLESVLTILLDNACKYTKKSDSIDVHISEKKSHIEISIQDSGIGISETEQEKIFDRFYRSDASRNTDGFGVGLSLAQSAVRNAGGKISLNSIIENRTEFILTLQKK